MRTISIGKLRGLQQCTTENGVFALLAVDHRQNLRRMLNSQTPEQVSATALITLKREIVNQLASAASAALLDPEFGAPQCIAGGDLSGKCGLVVALEATGYDGQTTARHSRLLNGWSAEAARRMGANAVKLLVYYHPDAPTANEIEWLVESTAEECAAQDLPLFLEPLGYSLDPTRKKLKPEERLQVVVETARRLSKLGIDVLKSEFPIDLEVEPDERAWQDACRELTNASRVPWILLSASVEFEIYLRQVIAACSAGASGVAVGRAVWQEAIALQGEARIEFLRTTGQRRMCQLTQLCRALAHPFTDFYSTPTVHTGWYRDYGSNPHPVAQSTVTVR